jgi:pyruvate kinase
VSLYRGVYAVRFEEPQNEPGTPHGRIFEALQQTGAVSPGDLIVLTMGQHLVAGRTNSMQILTVPGVAPAPASA